MTQIQSQSESISHNINLEIEKFLQKEAQQNLAREKDKTEMMAS